MAVVRNPETAPTRGMATRIAVVHLGVFAPIWVLLVARASSLATAEPALRELGEAQSAGVTRVDERRGTIRDRRGAPLAISVEAASVFVRPAEVRDIEATAALTANALSVPVEEVRERMESPRPFVWIKRFASLENGARVRAMRLAGVGVLAETRRTYTRPDLAAALIGTTTIDGAGASGVELSFDPELRGRRVSSRVGRDARGAVFNVAVSDDTRALASAGNDVTLTIDSEVQFAAEAALRDGIRNAEAAGGIAIVVDPHSGALLALAEQTATTGSTPNEAPGGPRINAIQSAIEPGSTMKALLFGVALTAQVKMTDRVFCERGEYAIGESTIRDDHKFGALTFADVLKHSSNIGAAKLARLLGASRVYDGFRAFGLGKPSGIEIASEAAGSLRGVREWGEFGLATSAFGQGISTTVLQLAMALSAIANGGELLRPQVALRVETPRGDVIWASTREVVRRVLAPDTASQLRRLLARVVERGGTAAGLKVPGATIAGKTGTAEKPDPRGGYSETGRIASFIGLAPVETARVVVGVFIDEPKKSPYGGVVAAPVFARITEAALRFLPSTGGSK